MLCCVSHPDSRADSEVLAFHCLRDKTPGDLPEIRKGGFAV
jgi:hypothetical protein